MFLKGLFSMKQHYCIENLNYIGNVKNIISIGGVNNLKFGEFNFIHESNKLSEIMCRQMKHLKIKYKNTFQVEVAN